MCFLSFLSIDLGAAMLARASPDFGSVSVISSFLLQDIPRHPDTRLFEVREEFTRSLFIGFQAHSRIYRNLFASGGPADAEPLITALVSPA